MLNMNESNLLVKILSEKDGVLEGEYYRISLLELPPVERAKFFLFRQGHRNYVFTKEDIEKLEVGIFPNHMA